MLALREKEEMAQKAALKLSSLLLIVLRRHLRSSIFPYFHLERLNIKVFTGLTCSRVAKEAGKPDPVYLAAEEVRRERFTYILAEAAARICPGFATASEPRLIYSFLV